MAAARRQAEITLFAADQIDQRRHADVAVWDWAVGPVAARRMAVAQALHEQVFAWLTLGDERNLAAAYVAGRPAYRRS